MTILMCLFVRSNYSEPYVCAVWINTVKFAIFIFTFPFFLARVLACIVALCFFFFLGVDYVYITYLIWVVVIVIIYLLRSYDII